jgi:hypothetical protein
MLQDDFVEPGCGLHKVHDKLSEVTEARKKCMPFEGTLDFPVLLVVTLLNIFTVGYWVNNVDDQKDIISMRGTEQENVQMIAVVFALVEMTPGLLFLWCAHYLPACLLPSDVHVGQGGHRVLLLHCIKDLYWLCTWHSGYANPKIPFA